MGFALSQEGDIVKLYVQNIWWPQLKEIFKDEVFMVKKFCVWMEANYDKDQGTDIVTVELRLNKKSLPFNQVDNTLIQKYSLKKFKWFDLELLKKEYSKHESNPTPPEEMWAYFVREYTNGLGFNCGLVEAKLENNEVQIEAEWSSSAFSFTFYNRSRLLPFLESLPENLKADDFEEVKQAAKDKLSYASKKLRANFKSAGNVNRMVYFTRLMRRT